jgi:hypothetical protein
MQDDVALYEPLVLGEANLLDVEAIVIVELCGASVVLEKTSSRTI